MLFRSDMRNLTEENIRTYFDEHEWININRQKTGVVSNIRLLDIHVGRGALVRSDGVVQFELAGRALLVERTDTVEVALGLEG